jgi:hypothetical protein
MALRVAALPPLRGMTVYGVSRKDGFVNALGLVWIRARALKVDL